MLLRFEDSSFDSNYVPLQNYSMEVNENKIRKVWQEKWKVGKGEKVENEIIEKSRFIVYPDHLRKYGTLSNKNLSKKLKYTHARFYRTVGARSTPVQRPSLFLSSVFVPSPPIIINYNNHPNSSRALFTLQAANKISLDINNYMYSARKLTNQRLDIPLNELRICDCNEYYKDVRQNNLTLCRDCADKKSFSRRKFVSQNKEASTDQSTMLLNDPYNLMRRNRLGVGEINERCKIKREKRNANFLTYHEHSSRTNQIKIKALEWKKKREEEEEEEEGEEEEKEKKKCISKDSTARRKSILECDINAYDLNKSNCTDAKNSNELDEDFSVALAELKILRPKLNKADVQKTIGSQKEKEKRKTISETKKKSEIILNGQRCNILDKSHHKYLCDDKGSKKSVTEIIVPGPDFPKRPPRRQKEQGFREVALKYSKPKSKSSPNLSIKSILKKAIENDNPSAVLNLLFENENSSFSETDVSSERIQLDILNPSSKKNIQNILKKKKQVQFKMTNSRESVNQSCVSSSDSIQKAEKKFISFPTDPYMLREEPTRTNIVRRSKSYEDLPVFTNDHIPEYVSRKSSNDDIERRDLHTKDIFTESSLKKSLSGRHLQFTLNKDGSVCNYNNTSYSSLFYDTMALRMRGLRFDSRKMFQLEKSKTINLPNEIVKKQEKRLPDKNQGNIITYEEFRKLTEESVDKKPIYSFRVASTTNDTHKSLKETKIKLPAPSPPPRQVIKSKNNEVSLKISPERIQTEIPAIRCNNPNSSEKEKHGGAELSRNIPDFTAECETKITDGKTVVNFVTCSRKSSFNSERPHLVTVHSKNVDGSEDHLKQQALHIFNKFHLNDTNKVTISVRNESELIEDGLNSSTCTIIETGSNSAVIPIVSTNNKTTLIVGSCANVVAEQLPFKPISPLAKEENVLKIEKPEEFFLPKNSSDLREKESFKKEEIDIGKIDPVEAVRRNLVPHICGKEGNHSTLMEIIKQSREDKKQKTNIKPAAQITNHSIKTKEISVTYSKSLALNFQNEEKTSFQSCKIEPRLEDDSASITSCSTLNSSAKNSSTSTSRCSSFRNNHYGCLGRNLGRNQASPLISSQLHLFSDLISEYSGQEKDKLECEYEIRNGLVDNKKFDLENVSEVLRDEFSLNQRKEKAGKDGKEVQDSLGFSLTFPLVSNERENLKLNKSIFEGASKYDILNYLVDAKERVQEDSYLKETVLGEDAESNRRLNFTQDKEMFNEGIKQILSSFKVNPEIVKASEAEFSVGLHESKYFREDLSSESLALEKELKESVKSTAEIERKDSGVGSETSNISRSKWQASSSSKENLEHLCEDCDQVVETQITNSGVMYIPLICRKCSKRRSERKEIIQEIVETEEKYGRDLRIVLEEFWKPMLVAGLLTPDQLSSIFLNTEELLENSKQFTEKLKDTLEVAFEQGDEDLLTVNMGKLFLEMGPMLHAFESYCTRQGAAAILLANLEKEKELLRIFLRVSQMENAILRRMNLNSFLMVPVQRVTKYPLLLARLYKVTPIHQEGRDLLKEAQRNIEIHLEHMNSETRDLSATKVWRRFSTSTIQSRKSAVELELNNIKLRKMAIDILEWNHDEVRFVIEGKLLYTQPTESNWKKGKTVKLAPVFALLVTLGKPNSKYKIDPGEHELTFPSRTGIREATFLLLKEKCGRYSLLREPLYLDKIIICCESEMDDYFEIQELSTKDSFIFKSDDAEKTKEWYKQLQYHAQILGAWRKRRNALANIMINGMMARVSLN